MRVQFYFCEGCGCVGAVTYSRGAQPKVVSALVVLDHRAKEPRCDEHPARLRVIVDRPVRRRG